jgi:hypothetical protein
MEERVLPPPRFLRGIGRGVRVAQHLFGLWRAVEGGDGGADARRDAAHLAFEGNRGFEAGDDAGRDGIELGKVLAKKILPELTDQSRPLGHDGSTNRQIRYYRSQRNREQ